MNLETVFRQNEKCPVRSIGEGLVIMAPSGDTTHSLEDLGVFIWNQLNGERNLEGVLHSIVQQYDVEKEEARADLIHFVTQMQNEGLILEI